MGIAHKIYESAATKNGKLDLGIRYDRHIHMSTKKPSKQKYNQKRDEKWINKSAKNQTHYQSRMALNNKMADVYSWKNQYKYDGISAKKDEWTNNNNSKKNNII